MDSEDQELDELESEILRKRKKKKLVISEYKPSGRSKG